jgi:hypothetical protein
MLSLFIWIDPPTELTELVTTGDPGTSQILRVEGRPDPFRNPECGALTVELLSPRRGNPYLWASDDHPLAVVPVDRFVIDWVKDQWASGNRIRLELSGDAAAGFIGRGHNTPDDFIIAAWDKEKARIVKLTCATLEVWVCNDRPEAMPLEAKFQTDLLASLKKIIGQLGWIVFACVALSAYLIAR